MIIVSVYTGYLVAIMGPFLIYIYGAMDQRNTATTVL